MKLEPVEETPNNYPEESTKNEPTQIFIVALHNKSINSNFKTSPSLVKTALFFVSFLNFPILKLLKYKQM